jgi:hypothetical protein
MVREPTEDVLEVGERIDVVVVTGAGEGAEDRRRPSAAVPPVVLRGGGSPDHPHATPCSGPDRRARVDASRALMSVGTARGHDGHRGLGRLGLVRVVALPIASFQCSFSFLVKGKATSSLATGREEPCSSRFI